MSDALSLGRRVRELREANSITMKSLAQSVGVTQGHLSAIEAGKTTNPGIDLVQSIAKVFGLTTSELIGEATAILGKRSAILSQWFDNEMDDLGREAVMVLAEFHRDQFHTPPSKKTSNG